MSVANQPILTSRRNDVTTLSTIVPKRLNGRTFAMIVPALMFGCCQ